MGQEADIEAMFSKIAGKYDFINHLISAGLDIGWRKRAVKLTEPKPDDKLIDFCCGTGTFSFAYAENPIAPAYITGCDFSEKMLELAHKKQKKKPLSAKFEWLCCDCTDIPLPDKSFTIASCAFGIRNIPDFREALKEMYRLLKDNGRAVILEFGLPTGSITRKIYLGYFCYILPRLAGSLSGQKYAYEHLKNSVCRWDAAVDLASELKTAGFADVTAKPLTFGVVKIFIARKRVLV